MEQAQHVDGRAVQSKPAGFRFLAGEPDPFRPGPGWNGRFSQQFPLAGFPSEAVMAEAVLDRLEPWFQVKTEAHGRYPGGTRCRIDAVLVPREPQLWKRPNVALGVEFKASDSREVWSHTDLTAWMAQAIDYAHVEWDDWGRLPVFMCPSPFAEERLPDGSLPPVEMFANGLMGHYGIGSLALYGGPGLSFVLQGRHRIWSERFGVEAGRHWTLRPRVGHR